MVKSLRVMLWGEEIGRLTWDERRKSSYFTYNPEYVKRGIDIAPLVAPIGSARSRMPIWGEEAKIYQRLPSFVADSLPDAWGNQLFDIWRQENHISNAEINPLDKLSFIGKRGMGALEYVPETSKLSSNEKIDIEALANMAQHIIDEREQVCIKPSESITMQSLLTVGTSAGGRQPKAIVAIDAKSGEIRSGQIAGLKGYDYYILKFGNSHYSSAEIEMVYYEMAKAAGIDMMHSQLFEVEGNVHFITQRFDRCSYANGEHKLHTQTLAAMSPDTNSYEGLIEVCRKLHLPEADCVEVFRRMIFNILTNNTDDHTKNFSFVMDPKGQWRLSPAYDITFVIDTGGYLPNTGHCMYVRAKMHGVTLNDALHFAKENGIARPNGIIRNVVLALKQFRTLATKYNVQDKWIATIESAIYKHLSDWGFGNSDEMTTFNIDGRIFTNVRIEQTYKGNFHLYATEDGKERKYVIGKNKPEHREIQNICITNLSREYVCELIKHCLF